MDLLTLLIYLSLFLIGAGLVIMLIFGAINMSRGKSNPFVIVAAVVPLLIFGLTYATAPSALPDGVTAAEHAIIYTVVIMLGLALVLLALSALRGVLRFGK